MRTSHFTSCFFLSLRCLNLPTSTGAIFPSRPASSNASISAVPCGVLRSIGQPFGTDQRPLFPCRDQQHFQPVLMPPKRQRSVLLRFHKLSLGQQNRKHPSRFQQSVHFTRPGASVLVAGARCSW